MRLFKFAIFFALTLSLVYVLDHRWLINGNPVPPLGKFLDPFHGFWQNIEPAGSEQLQELTLAGLKDEVSVVYDSLLIPHIFAENEEDLYFAQGYVTAMHRLWQMEFQTHAAAGRISEIIGKVALDYDRSQRRLGMVHGAEKFTQAISRNKAVAVATEKYTEGVNAYIASLSYKELPFEYKLLDYKPEEWNTLKMGLLLKNLSQTLNIAESDLEMTNALKVFGKDMVELLYFENDHPSGDPIVDNPGGWNFIPETLDSIPPALPDEFVDVDRPKEKKRGIGSNNWAVHGSKTASGYPILCNDPHLTLSYPSLWYVVHLNAPNVNAMGGSLPGSPFVILGFNDSIAWGCTNAQRDAVDWYKIQFRDARRNEYVSDGAYKATSKKVEEFKIRGGESFFDTIVFTHHGPVTYDRNFKSGDEKTNYAMRWLAHDESQELSTFYELNHAKNYDDYLAALKNWSAPAQNFAFASVHGDIAIRVEGKYPLRRKNEGRFVLDGTDSRTEWQKFIPKEQNVNSKNPTRGFVSSANQYPADATYPYYIQSDWYESFRNRRINQVLEKSSAVTPAAMMALQNDNFNLQASESLPFMLSQLDVSTLKGEESRIAESLTYWDFVNSKESAAASYYEAWWRSFLRLAWDEMADAKISLVTPENANVIRLMKNYPDLPFWDIRSTQETESLSEVIRMSFLQAVKTVNDWEKEQGRSAMWADFKDTYVEHLLRIAPLSSHVRIGGYEGIVNAADERTGPSWRFIVSLEKNQVKAWGVYPGGQSGNPGSYFYDNMVQHWADGKYYPLIFTSSIDAVRSKSYSSAQLNPEDK
jgi:penicillin G amidase